MCIYLHVHMCVCIICLCMFSHTYINTYMHTYIHTYIHDQATDEDDMRQNLLIELSEEGLMASEEEADSNEARVRWRGTFRKPGSGTEYGVGGMHSRVMKNLRIGRPAEF